MRWILLIRQSHIWFNFTHHPSPFVHLKESKTTTATTAPIIILPPENHHRAVEECIKLLILSVWRGLEEKWHLSPCFHSAPLSQHGLVVIYLSGGYPPVKEDHLRVSTKIIFGQICGFLATLGQLGNCGCANLPSYHSLPCSISSNRIKLIWLSQVGKWILHAQWFINSTELRVESCVQRERASGEASLTYSLSHYTT